MPFTAAVTLISKRACASSVPPCLAWLIAVSQGRREARARVTSSRQGLGWTPAQSLGVPFVAEFPAARGGASRGCEPILHRFSTGARRSGRRKRSAFRPVANGAPHPGRQIARPEAA